MPVSTLDLDRLGVIRAIASAVALAMVFGVLFSASDTSAQQFEARVDRREMALNETLTLEVTYAERASTSAIDFEAMLPDFSILSIHPASQTRFMNLQRTSQTSWQLSLMPKHEGRLQIPSFNIGNARTRPIEIRVTAAPQSPEDGAAFTARLSVDRERAFVGEQVLIRIALTTAPGVTDLRGAPLELPNVDITLVNQSEFQRMVGSTPYQVAELTYAAFPKTPGTLSIDSLQYTGSIRRAQRIVARTQPVALEILDPASDPEASRKRPWLPADAVALASDWSGDVDALVVGEPVTRTIQIAAAGQRAAAIAPLTLPDGAFKQYAEQPILEDLETPTGILGRRTDSIVIVPTEVGTITLPPIEVDWWNIGENRWQVARLPAETLEVKPGSPSAMPPPGLPTASAPAGDEGTAGTLPDAVRTIPSGPAGLTLGLGILSALLFAVCIGLWIRVRRLEAAMSRRSAASNDDHFGRSAKEKDAYNRMLRTLTKRDPLDARRAILAWADLHWPDHRITRLDQIAAMTSDSALKATLDALDAHLYRGERGTAPNDAEAIDFDVLKRRLEGLRNQPKGESSPSPSALDALYPGQTG